MGRASGWLLWLALAAVVGCTERVQSFGELGVSGNPLRGQQLVEHFECNRCHQPRMTVDGRNCLSCHDAIGQGRSVALPGRPDRGDLESWARRIQHYREVPSLHATGKLLRRDWIARFLLAPHDLRPRLSETMPRLPMSERDARDVAAYLAAAERAEPFFADRAIADWTKPLGPNLPVGDRDRGRALFADKGCNACHLYSGATEGVTVTADRLEERSLLLAVDLRHTRDRFQAKRLVAWILAPRHHKVDAVMPELGLTYQQARDLAAFIMDEPLAEVDGGAKVERLPLLSRTVTFDEVNDALFSRTCVHCHDDADLGVLGDGGPGNVGGFGFGAKGLSFASYEAIHAGWVDERGERRSVFERTDDGTPRLVKVLLLRRDEEAGLHGSEMRGMPLSLPSVTPEVLQLVESWVAQGRPR